MRVLCKNERVLCLPSRCAWVYSKTVDCKIGKGSHYTQQKHFFAAWIAQGCWSCATGAAAAYGLDAMRLFSGYARKSLPRPVDVRQIARKRPAVHDHGTTAKWPFGPAEQKNAGCIARRTPARQRGLVGFLVCGRAAQCAYCLEQHDLQTICKITSAPMHHWSHHLQWGKGSRSCPP